MIRHSTTQLPPVASPLMLDALVGVTPPPDDVRDWARRLCEKYGRNELQRRTRLSWPTLTKLAAGLPVRPATLLAADAARKSMPAE